MPDYSSATPVAIPTSDTAYGNAPAMNSSPLATAAQQARNAVTSYNNGDLQTAWSQANAAQFGATSDPDGTALASSARSFRNMIAANNYQKSADEDAAAAELGQTADNVLSIATTGTNTNVDATDLSNLQAQQNAAVAQQNSNDEAAATSDAIQGALLTNPVSSALGNVGSDIVSAGKSAVNAVTNAVTNFPSIQSLITPILLVLGAVIVIILFMKFG